MDRSAGRADLAKIAALAVVRRINHLSIERWSRYTYRPWVKLRLRQHQLVRAREHYGADDLPDALWVASPIPAVGRLNALYVLPYYGLTGSAFRWYHRRPIDRAVRWDPEAGYARWFAHDPEGWGNTQDDAAFARLRLQGPNPYGLTCDGEGFVVDYRALFEGIAPPVVCRFAVEDGALTAASIQVGDALHRPSDPGWRQAKLVANALDARVTIFAHHLLTAHFLVAQAFALAALSLPRRHPFARWQRLFTNGVLQVNDYAFRLLLTPTSYFMQSGFVDRPRALRLFENRLRGFSLDELVVPRDVARRGLERLPDHPYVQDVLPIWRAFHAYAEEVVATLFPTEASLAADADVAAWHQTLLAVLPGVPADLAELAGRSTLATWLAILCFDNVYHEITGDFSPYAIAPDPEQKRLIHLDRVLAGDAGPPSLHDVFLFEQGAYAGQFNTAGNNLLRTPFAARLRDPALIACTERLHAELRRLEAAIEDRNRSRVTPFLRALPGHWEWSVSF